jgi:hypothetical protein
MNALQGVKISTLCGSGATATTPSATTTSTPASTTSKSAGAQQIALHRGRKEYWEQIELATITIRALRGEGSLDRIKRHQKQWAFSFTPSDVHTQ